MVFEEYDNLDENQKIALESLELYRRYNNSAREEWAENVREDEQFRFNAQWTTKQKDELAKRGHSAVVINQIDPAVDAAKAIMTSRRPGWSAVAREDTDVKLAKVVETLLEYTYDISNGDVCISNGVDDYLTKSMMVMLAYYDPYAEDGIGRVKITDVDPLTVFIDPASRRRDAEDASNILIVSTMTVDQAIRYMPDKADLIRKAQPSNENVYPSPDRVAGEGQVFPGDIDTSEENETRLVIERYTKKEVRRYYVSERFQGGSEFVFNEEQYQNYLQKEFYVYDNIVVPADDPQAVQVLVSQIDPALINAIARITAADAIEIGHITVDVKRTVRVFRYLSIENILLSEEIIESPEYPIKFAMNKWNRTPYPLSDVRFVKGINQYYNKGNSLLLAHAIRSTNVPLLVPRGSGNIKTIREEYLKPDAVIEYNPEFGTPFTPNQIPMAAEMFAQLDRWRRDIQYQFGIPELLHGFVPDSPQTFRGTMAIEEYGQRKLKCKLRDIEQALSGLGRVVFRMIQQYYTRDEIIRVVQPSGQISEVRINYMGVDEYSNEIKKINDLRTINVDIKVLCGSTLASNRWAQFDYYMQLADRGLIDQVEVLKKTELVDVDGVLQRSSHIRQLENIVAQQEEEIKRLQADLQVLEHESRRDRKRVEIEKFKTGLNKFQSDARAASTIFDARLEDELNNVRTILRNQNRVAEKSKRKKERR